MPKAASTEAEIKEVKDKEIQEKVEIKEPPRYDSQGKPLPPRYEIKTVVVSYENCKGQGDSKVFINGAPALVAGAKVKATKKATEVEYGYTDSGKKYVASKVEREPEEGNEDLTVGGGSASVFVNGQPLAREGDKIVLGKTEVSKITKGSENVFSK